MELCYSCAEENEKKTKCSQSLKREAETVFEDIGVFEINNKVVEV